MRTAEELIALARTKAMPKPPVHKSFVRLWPYVDERVKAGVKSGHVIAIELIEEKELEPARRQAFLSALYRRRNKQAEAARAATPTTPQ